MDSYFKTLIISALVLFGSALNAQDWLQVQKVLPPADATSPIGGQSDRVGWAVAADGDFMVAGAPESDVNGTASGAAFVYEKVAGTWTYVAQLAPADGEPGDNFGWSVDVSGDRIAVGAIGDNAGATSAGSTYIFERIGGVWTETAFLLHSDPSSSDKFGYSVSIDGDRVLIGCFDDDDNGFSSGSAYIFEVSAGVWSQTAKLLASDGAGNDNFGISVSLSDTVAVCGAYFNDQGGNNRGAAYVFHRDNGLWSQVQKLQAPDAANNDQFGIAVAVDGESIAVGANNDDDSGSNSGSVNTWVLSGGTWNFESKLLAPGGAANDFFGRSLSMDGNRLLISSFLDDDLGANSGSVYIFDKAVSWFFSQKLTAPDGAVQDFFGFAVGVSGDELVVGARGDDDSGNDSGSIYIYSNSGGVWSFNYKGTANDMIDDPAQDLYGSSVALDGDYAVVGSYGDDDQGVSAGSVRFYTFNGSFWQDEGKFYSSDIAQEDFFGYRVALSGTTAMISSYGDDDDGAFSGSVYVFERIGGAWVETQKLTASDAAPFDDFGFSLALDGDKAVISSYLDDDFGNFSGSAYIFEKIGGVWVESQKLLPISGAANDLFGYSVDIDTANDMVVIGARNESSVESFGGAAYVFELQVGTWTQTGKLSPNDPTANKLFGQSVSISDGTAIVGAVGDDAGQMSSGAVYVYEKVAATWTQLVKLKSNNVSVSESFGYGLDNEGRSLAIGGYRSPDNVNVTSGAVFLIDGSSGSWVYTDKLTSLDGQANDYFGIHLDLDGDRLLIGAQFDDDNGMNAGSAYFFAECLDLNMNDICDFAELTFSNNECSGAVDLVPSVFGITDWHDQSTFGATESLEGCDGDADNDVWFSFTAVSSNDVLLAKDMSGSRDMVIELFDGCEGVSLGCFDAYGSGAVERALKGDLMPGTSYVFRVFSKGAVISSSDSVRVMVKTFEDAQLAATYCGIENQELSNSIYSERQDQAEIYSNPGVGVNGYRFRFQEQGGGLDVTVERPMVNGFYLQLTNVPGLEYGKTYNVSVSHRVGVPANGFLDFYWSHFGSLCTVGLAAQIPLTRVREELCLGDVDFYLGDQLFAEAVAGADQYRFTFTSTGGTDVGQVYTKGTQNYTVFLQQVGTPGNGLLYGSTYSVTVQSRVQGLWSQMGPFCTIAMAGQPQSTQLRSQYCNGTFLFPSSNFVLAETVFGASLYQWSFTPSLGGTPLTFTTPTYSFTFGPNNQGFVSGSTYDVEIRAFAGGAWGDYVPSCQISIQGAPISPNQEDVTLNKRLSSSEFRIYPNPLSGNELNISFLTGEESESMVILELFSLQGEALLKRTLPVKSEKASYQLDLGKNISNGVYILKLNNGENESVFRIVKN